MNCRVIFLTMNRVRTHVWLCCSARFQIQEHGSCCSLAGRVPRVLAWWWVMNWSILFALIMTLKKTTASTWRRLWRYIFQLYYLCRNIAEAGNCLGGLMVNVCLKIRRSGDLTLLFLVDSYQWLNINSKCSNDPYSQWQLPPLHYQPS